MKFVALPLAASLGIVLFLYYQTYAAEESITQNYLKSEADFLTDDLNESLNSYAKALKSLGDFYAMISAKHDPDTFRDMTKNLIDLYSGIREISWNPMTSKSDETDLEKTIRTRGFSDFSLKEISSDRALQNAPPRSFYKSFATPAEIMFIYPVRSKNKHQMIPKSSVIDGYIVATIRIQDMINSIIGNRLNTQHLDLHLDSIDGENLYDSLGPKSTKYQNYTQTRYLSGLIGAKSKITLVPTDAFFETFGKRNSTVVLEGGLVFIGFLWTFLLVLRGRDESLSLATNEKFKTQAALATAEARKAAALEASLDAIIAIDCQGRILDFNPSAEKMFLYKKEEVIGQDLSSKIIPERFRKAHKEGVARFLSTRIPKILGARLEVFAIRSDGSEFPIEISPVSLQVNGETYFTGVVRDITERKTFEEKLKAAKEAAEAANEAKSKFLANMSHEIRTPLGSVLGFSEIIASKKISDDEREKYLEIIKRNGALLSNVIDDILDLSKVEAGKIEVDIGKCSVQELLDDVKALLVPQTLDKGIYLNLDIDPSMPVNIYTDPLRLRQILINIVGNAIKFTTHGGVKVIAYLANSEIAHGCVTFDVIDTGPGISTEDAAKLFHPFTQADSSNNRRFGGTGLGLVLAKKFAKLLGGDVSLPKSNTGEGSVFRISVSADLRAGQKKN